MFLIHQVIARSEGDESSVVRRCWNGHGAGAAHVCVTQLIG